VAGQRERDRGAPYLEGFFPRALKFGVWYIGRVQWRDVHSVVLRAQAGDQEAWGCLKVQAEPYLLRYAATLLGPRWPEKSVSDLLQITWMRVWKGLQNFKGGSDDAQTGAILRAWLRRIMRNAYLNEIRKQSLDALPLSQRGPGESTVDRANLDPPADQSTPSANLHAEDRRRLVERALDQIADARDREIVRLFFFEGMSLAQIAKQLNRTFDQIRTGFRRAREQLKFELKELQ
jgi:RNA polymerase sigma factor (sigma-70 family)